MKKFIFGSALFIVLMCTFNIKVKANVDDYSLVGVRPYSTYSYYVSVNKECFNNETVFQVDNHNFIKPCAAYINGTLRIFSYYYNYDNIVEFNLENDEVTYSYYSRYYDYSTTVFYDISMLSYSTIPIFNNIDTASAYSMGTSFNQSDLIAGTVPFIKPSIGNERYENQIYNFQKVWNVYSRPTTRMSWNIAWIQHYDNDLYESSDFHRQIGITVKYPDYTSMANLYDSVFNEPQSFFTTLEYAKSFFTYDNMYDSRLTYKETTVWIDIDDMINDVEANGSSSQWYNWYQFTSNTDKNEYNFTLYETLEDAFTAGNWGESYSYNPKGIVNIFRNYYNNDRLLLFALPFCIFDKAQMFTFNEPDNIVYNPIYIFWFDATAPDGTRSEKRNFGNPTDITSDNLVEPDDSNNNLGVPNGVPNPSEQQLVSNYNSSIQDSYNNIYNNYYYTSEQNKDLLDYLMKFKDGGTEQDVQNAFGYVNTTIDSVSNVPIMLGKLFTGFFPPKVILLFSALFIIFSVFIIVKIVRHLFL